MSAPAAPRRAGDRLCLQQQSPLFDKLSPEIRQMIYNHVIAGHCFYIIRRTSGLAHVTRSYSRFEIPTQLSIEAFLRLARQSSNIRPQSLLETCRAVYAETSHLLYSGNTFDTQQVVDFISLMSTPTQHRLHSIRTITAFWPVGAKRFENGSSVIESVGWEKAWSLLSQMKNLRELAVKLHFYDSETSPYSAMTEDEAKARFMPNEREILRLPWTVKLSQKWKLRVNWPQCVMDDFDDAPFTIERTDTLF